MKAPTQAAQRRTRRAAVAGRFVGHEAEAVVALDWAALDAAPHWLALPDAEFDRLRCRAGALLCARTLRLWIDGARLAAARERVGDAFLGRLIAEPDRTPVPLGAAVPPMRDAHDVTPALRSAGAAVLLEALPHGPLRDAVGAALEPVAPSLLTPEAAQRLLAVALESGEAAS